MSKQAISIGDIFPNKKYGDFLILEITNAKSIRGKFIKSGFELTTRADHIRSEQIKDPTQVFWYEGKAHNDDYFNTSHKCPFYKKWVQVLERTLCKKYKIKRPTYSDVTICDEWLLFSNFKAWMEKQDWEGKVLDKDILSGDKKVYSPETCAFVLSKTNSFILDNKKYRNGMIGTTFLSSRGKYISGIKYNGARIHLGMFDTEIDAHLAWKREKHKIACELSELETDERIKAKLKTLYVL